MAGAAGIGTAFPTDVADLAWLLVGLSMYVLFGAGLLILLWSFVDPKGADTGASGRAEPGSKEQCRLGYAVVAGAVTTATAAVVGGATMSCAALAAALVLLVATAMLAARLRFRTGRSR